MTGEAIFITILLVAAIPLKYIVTRISKVRRKSSIEKELNQMFLWFWDGSPEDNLYAWYKVRSVLKQRDGNREMVEYIDQKIHELDNKSMLGDMEITQSGKLVDKNINSVVQ